MLQSSSSFWRTFLSFSGLVVAEFLKGRKWRAAESLSLLLWCSWVPLPSVKVRLFCYSVTELSLLCTVFLSSLYLLLYGELCKWTLLHFVTTCFLSPERNESEKPGSGAALPLHQNRAQTHWPPHWEGGADSCQLSLRGNWSHVRPNFKIFTLSR